MPRSPTTKPVNPSGLAYTMPISTMLEASTTVTKLKSLISPRPNSAYNWPATEVLSVPMLSQSAATLEPAAYPKTAANPNKQPKQHRPAEKAFPALNNNHENVLTFLNFLNSHRLCRPKPG